ncbi:hypothetical protein ElyMa_000907600 [Elysia marginata]|uniref:Uncharacterized protein n=1 Tax=Elysia marginata TaxID=1093978 RepID=A0AAV4HB44_9GAST|nr:hypothetical protein ElyMa_000907600 [Elysia marginata]
MQGESHNADNDSDTDMILEQNSFSMGGDGSSSGNVNGAEGFNGMGGVDGSDINLQMQQPHVAISSVSHSEPLQMDEVWLADATDDGPITP